MGEAAVVLAQPVQPGLRESTAPPVKTAALARLAPLGQQGLPEQLAPPALQRFSLLKQQKVKWVLLGLLEQLELPVQQEPLAQPVLLAPPSFSSATQVRKA